MSWIVEEIKKVMDSKETDDGKKLLAIRNILASLPKVGDTVHVIGIASWQDWTGKLVSIDEPANRAIIEVERKKSGRVSYPTSLANVRKGEYPRKDKK